MKRSIFIISLCLLVAAIPASFFLGRSTVQTSNVAQTVKAISYDELTSLRENGDPFILYIHRSSCKVCAIVSNSLSSFTGLGLPIYSLNMEEYLGSDFYDEVKETLNYYYVPCFKYYKDGMELAHLNNPLPNEYFDTDIGAERVPMREEMEKNVIDFISAAASGEGLITETPLTNVVTGEVVSAPEAEAPSMEPGSLSEEILDE